MFVTYVIMASTLFWVVYPFPRVKGNLPVLMATRTGNLHVPVDGAVYRSLLRAINSGILLTGPV